MVSGDDKNWSCHKHGIFAPMEAARENEHFQAPFPECPRCEHVKLLGLCRDCELHAGNVPFAHSGFHYTHGFVTNICRCCYFKRVEEVYLETKQNYEDLKFGLEHKPCV